jgi:hypothetical protein
VCAFREKRFAVRVAVTCVAHFATIYPTFTPLFSDCEVSVKNTAILYPVFALVAWTFLVLLHLARTRIFSRLHPKEFRYGESATVPAPVSIPNRNYMNLLELPMLFYVVCVMLFVAGGASQTAVNLAWAYVLLRVFHSLVHLSYNNVLHRLAVFALSNVVLAMLWVNAAGAILR